MIDLESIPKNEKETQIIKFRAPRGLEVPAHFDLSKQEVFVKICQTADWIKFSDLYAVELLVDELFLRVELLTQAEHFKDGREWVDYNRFLNLAGRATDRIMKLMNSLGMTPKTCPKYVSHGPSADKLIGILEGA